MPDFVGTGVARSGVGCKARRGAMIGTATHHRLPWMHSPLWPARAAPRAPAILVHDPPLRVPRTWHTIVVALAVVAAVVFGAVSAAMLLGAARDTAVEFTAASVW